MPAPTAEPAKNIARNPPSARLPSSGRFGAVDRRRALSRGILVGEARQPLRFEPPIANKERSDPPRIKREQALADNPRKSP